MVVGVVVMDAAAVEGHDDEVAGLVLEKAFVVEVGGSSSGGRG